MERRSEKRAKEGWTHSEVYAHGWIREMRGHHLIIFKPNSGGSYWYKYIDGYARGRVETLKVAKLQLEAEACGESLAFGIK